MRMIKLTTGEQRELSIWINPITCAVINQKIGAKYKALVVAAGQAYMVWESADEIAKMVNEQLKEG